MIHVCYALYDPSGHYSKFIGTSICSLLENTNELVTIHLLHDETLTEQNYNKFLKLVESYNQHINFYLVKLDEVASEFMKSFSPSPATLYRLGIADLLPNFISKVIYIDGDTIVNMDIKNFWTEDIEDYVLGAVLDTGVNKAEGYKMFPIITQGFVKREDYFNAGVLIMNLNRLRSIENFYYKTIELFRENLKFFVGHDQDLLNYLFSTQYKKISNDYNRQLAMEKNLGLKKVGRAIYHYINSSVNINPNDEFDKLYWSYFIKTPWFNEEVLLYGFNNFKSKALSKQALMLKTILKVIYTHDYKIIWTSQDWKDSIIEILKQFDFKENIFLDSVENGGGIQIHHS